MVELSPELVVFVERFNAQDRDVGGRVDGAFEQFVEDFSE